MARLIFFRNNQNPLFLLPNPWKIHGRTGFQETSEECFQQSWRGNKVWRQLCLKNLDGTQLSIQLCPTLLLLLSLNSPAPAPAGISCSHGQAAPSQPHPDEGSNKSLQTWAEHFHPREELIKHTSDVFAFIWQLFSGTTRFYPEKQWFAQVSDLSQSSVKSREYLLCSSMQRKLQEFSVLSQENLFAAELFISSAELNTPKLVTIHIITPNVWCAPIIQWNSLFKVVHQMSVLWILFLAGHLPLARSWSWQRIS